MIASIDSIGPGRAYAEVIGDPITHSKSPLIHNHWLRAAKQAFDYRACHVAPDQLGDYIALRAYDPDWRGCNVTIPHKLAILDHVADPGDVRGSIGAANTVFRKADGTLVATNTDAAGFFAPIADVPLEGREAVVIGAGGAARAVLFALSRANVGPVTIINRNVLKGSALLAQFGLTGRAVPLGSPLSAKVALVVNASALGMTGHPALDIDLSPLADHAIIYDLVYAPLVTDLLAQADARGLTSIDGLDMLVGQAALAFELFFGFAPDRDGDDRLWQLLVGQSRTGGQS